MGNILTPFKKLLANKNTVTILGVLLGIVVLYFAYDSRVQASISPVSIPYAKQEITSRTKIEESMIGYTEVPKSLVTASSNLVTTGANVIGKYVSYATTIPKNSLFYSEVLMNESEMPDSSFANIPDGNTIFSLAVDNHTTYGNSIFPGNSIDLYMTTTDDDNNGKLVYGKLIESIEVLDVKDSSGNHVFETTNNNSEPAELLFSVPENLYLLLSKAVYLSSIEIIPVPRNASYSANPEQTNVSSDWLQNFIISKTVIIPDEDTN